MRSINELLMAARWKLGRALAKVERKPGARTDVATSSGSPIRLAYRSTDKLWEAGERQLKHLESTAERQLRAYVYVVGKDFLVQGEEHERFINQIRILNSGQTPAYKFASPIGDADIAVSAAYRF